MDLLLYWDCQVSAQLPNIYFKLFMEPFPNCVLILIHMCHLLKSLFLSWTIFTRNWIKCLVQGGEVEELSSYSICLWGVCYRIFNVLILDFLKELLMILMKRCSFMQTEQSQLIKPELCEKSYELRQLMCRKLDVEHPALHSSLPLSNNKSGMSEKDSNPFSNSTKGKELNIKELLACPLFIKEISKSIVSAGKSWQLVRHVPVLFSMMSEIRRHPDINVPGGSTDDRGFKHLPTDLCSVNVAGDYVFRGHISRYF